MGQATSVLKMSREALSGYPVSEIENFSHDLIQILKWNIENNQKEDLPALTEVTASATNAGATDKEKEDSYKKLDLNALLSV